MSDAVDRADVAGTYAIDREGYLADMREALSVQMAELEAMLARARTAEEATPSEIGAERLAAFEASVERVRAESETLLDRVPDPLAVGLELDAEGGFRMAVTSPSGTATGKGTWSLRGATVVLLHLEERGAALETPVTEELALKDGALEKRASAEHFPFFLRRVEA
ncbi:MAG: hypothetical protein QNJ98_05310 [Planctomycetota bacterium]|nr:hypothetical protein [Planctomycetota bacterium]